MTRVALAVFCLCLAFSAGLVVGRVAPGATSSALPRAEAPDLPVMSASVDGACKRALVHARTELAICLAFRAPPESSAPIPPSSPTEVLPEWDELTARLVRTHTTNTEEVVVELPGPGPRFRAYPPGGWPPPDGPPPGARIASRRVDGGTEMTAADGGVRVLPDPDPSAPLPWGLSPSPKEDAGSPGAAP